MKTRVLVFALILMVSTVSAFSFQPDKGEAAVIQLSGQITPSKGILGSDAFTPGQIRELNQRALSKGADAIIYEINSGGGSVVASKESMRVIESVQMPTVCRFRDVAASGAYLASLGCDSIVADRASLTGSIGVQGSYLELSGLLRKLGIEQVNVTSGRRKDIGSRYRNATPEERRILQRKAERVHDQFVELVRVERNLSQEQVEEVRTGEPFLGERAEALGLVDELGGREKSVETAEDLTGKELKTFKVESRKPFNLLSLLSARTAGLEMFSGSNLQAVFR